MVSTEISMDFSKNNMTFRGHSNGSKVIIQLNNGRIASAGTDKTIKIWDLVSGNCDQTIQLININNKRFYNEINYIIIKMNGKIRLIEKEKGQILSHYRAKS